MERVKTYINCVSDANVRARSLYMSLCDKYDYHAQERILNKADIFQWVQGWGSTACGFGGIGGAAMTDADCVVVEFNSRFNIYLNLACVYHNGRFAYSCKINDAYKEMVKNRSMVGQADAENTDLELIDYTYQE